MFVIELLRTSPMSAIALMLTIATLFWCLRLVRQQHSKVDRYLMGVLGLIAMSQGLQILGNAGFWSLPPQMKSLSGAVEMTIAALYFISTLILQISSQDRHNTRIQLRVVEAIQPAPAPAKHPLQLAERTAIAVFGVSERGDVNLWHSSSEDFFGWRKDDVVGTRLPFLDGFQPAKIDDATMTGVPRILRLRTKHEEELDAIVWFMPVPGESSSLVLVLDYRKNHPSDPVKVPLPTVGRLVEQAHGHA